MTDLMEHWNKDHCDDDFDRVDGNILAERLKVMHFDHHESMELDHVHVVVKEIIEHYDEEKEAYTGEFELYVESEDGSDGWGYYPSHEETIAIHADVLKVGSVLKVDPEELS